MRISDWSSDVCSSDLNAIPTRAAASYRNLTPRQAISSTLWRFHISDGCSSETLGCHRPSTHGRRNDEPLYGGLRRKGCGNRSRRLRLRMIAGLLLAASVVPAGTTDRKSAERGKRWDV